MDCGLYSETLSAQDALPTRVSARSILLREATFDDHARIAALQIRNGLRTRSNADWRRLWITNPAYLAKRLPIGWVLEGPDGQIGGYLGNLPLSYRFRGEWIHAATDHSWVVDPQYRLRSVELLNRFLRQPEIDLFICATPNSTAERILRAFEFIPASSGRWNQAGFWITGYRGFSAAALRAASIRGWRALSYPLSAALALGDWIQPFFGKPGPRDAHGEFEIASHFDERFDTFWGELQRESGVRLLADRSRAALEWHFQHSLDRGGARLLTAARNGRLVAYAVFDRYDHPDLGLKRMRIADFQALHGFEELLSPALRWAIEASRKEGLHLVENAGCWSESLGVRGTVPPHHRHLPWGRFYFKTRDDELARQLKNPEVWTPTGFDGDATLQTGPFIDERKIQ